MTTTATFKLEKVDEDVGRIFSGQQIVAHVVWTDSFWCLTGVNRDGILATYVDLTDPEDMSDAYLRAIADGTLGAQSTDLDFVLDPPTFVGPTEGERACWVYTVAKRFDAGAMTDMREWTGADYAAASAIYRRARRKYGDSPPDRTSEVMRAMKG